MFIVPQDCHFQQLLCRETWRFPSQIFLSGSVTPCLSSGWKEIVGIFVLALNLPNLQELQIKSNYRQCGPSASLRKDIGDPDSYLMFFSSLFALKQADSEWGHGSRSEHSQDPTWVFFPSSHQATYYNFLYKGFKAFKDSCDYICISFSWANDFNLGVLNW